MIREAIAAWSARWGLGHVDQHAVAAEAHHRVAFVGLDVDVAGGLAHGLGEQRVDHADDRRVVLGFEQVFDGRQLGHELGEVDLLAHVGNDLGGVAVGAGIGLGEARLEGGAGDVLDLQGQAQAAAHLGQGLEAGALAQQQLGVLGPLPGHQNAVGLGEGVGQGGGAHGATVAAGGSRGAVVGTL